MSARRPPLLPAEGRLIALDAEATALADGQICQLAYLIWENGAVAGKNFFFRVDAMSESARRVHGLTPEALMALSGGRTFRSRAAEIYADIAGADLLIGHKVSFDERCLRTEFARLDIAMPRVPLLCTLRAFTGVVTSVPRQRGGKYKPPSLSELTDFLGLAPDYISLRAAEWFGGGASLHDARYDAAAVWLAAEKGLGRAPGPCME